MLKFTDTNLLADLNALNEDDLDSLPFGVIGFDKSYTVRRYNRLEAMMSGFQRSFVMNKSFFLEVAPCMNNYRVALKFAQENELDQVVPYFLSFKVKPVSVTLRLLKSESSDLCYVLIER